jgi:hypothetical protein
MERARPLRDVFADLVGTDTPHRPHRTGRGAAGQRPPRPARHLVAEAVGSYADTAPIEVAEHLSPYVMAHSPGAPGRRPRGRSGLPGSTPSRPRPPPTSVRTWAGSTISPTWLTWPARSDAPAGPGGDHGHDLAFGHGSAPGADLAGDSMGTYEHDTVGPDHPGDPGLDVLEHPAT